MANHVSLSQAQTKALSKWLEETMPSSLDALAKKVGTEDAFRLASLRERLKEKSAKS